MKTRRVESSASARDATRICEHARNLSRGPREEGRCQEGGTCQSAPPNRQTAPTSPMRLLQRRRAGRPRGAAQAQASLRLRGAGTARRVPRYANVMEAPRLEKIVVNMGIGRATQQPSLIEGAVRDLEIITGQKPLVTRARRSIANFKLREGMNIGVKVTMRGDRAWEFLDRLIALAIPRIRDFRGLSPRSFDGHGNYTFGVNEQLIFPEVDYDRVDTTRGMDITICTTARTDEQGRSPHRIRVPVPAGGCLAPWPRRHLSRSSNANRIQGPGLHPVPAMRPSEGCVQEVPACAGSACASSFTPGRSPA